MIDRDLLAEYGATFKSIPETIKLASLERFLTTVCEFNNASIVTKGEGELRSNGWPTTYNLVRCLMPELDYRGLDDLLEPHFASNSSDHTYLPSNVPNCLIRTPVVAGSGALLFFANSNAGTEYLYLVQYTPSTDHISIFAPIPEPNSLGNIFQTLCQCINWLPNSATLPFLSCRENRMKLTRDVQARDECIFMNTNVHDHLGHYVLNYLGPIVSYIADGFFASESPLLISARESYLGRHEHITIIPSVPNYPNPPNNVVHINNVTEALEFCNSRNAGLFFLSGSRVSSALSFAVHACLTENFIPSIKDEEHHTLRIGVGLRGGTRMATNLIDILSATVRRLSEHVNPAEIHFIFDGMCKATEPKNTSTALLSLEEELAQSTSISNLLADMGCKSYSVVGKPLIDQLARLNETDAIITHNGSGSAKYLWLLNKPTIVLDNRYGMPREYCSSSDADTDSHVGLFFGRAFRGEPHATEFYIPSHCLTTAKDSELSDDSRGNFVLDPDSTSDSIVSYILKITQKQNTTTQGTKLDV